MYQLLLFFTILIITGRPIDKEVVSCAPPAKCYGKTPCNACSTCSSCAYCNSGGTCSVCARPKIKAKTATPNSFYSDQATSGQCKAITKKGTRCSRGGMYSGYCWQHKG